jgi:catechol 2,3-dioxygenase-like lactoylglutathione lyase family enzyme
MFNGIAHLTLRVAAFDACREVYIGKLGLRELAYGGPAGRRIFIAALGRSRLEWHEDASVTPACHPDTGQPLTSMYDNGGWVSHFAFPMRGARHVYERLAARGIAWTCKPVDQPLGHHIVRRRLIEFADPAYLTVQFAERIDNEGRSLEPTDDPPDLPWPGCTRIDHVMLNAVDLRAKRSFYVDALGLPATPLQPTRLGQQCDVTVGESIIELTWQPAVQPPLHRSVVAGIGLLADDLDAARRVLLRRGLDVSATRDIYPLPGLCRRVATLIDPDGLPLDLVQAG